MTKLLKRFIRRMVLWANKEDTSYVDMVTSNTVGVPMRGNNGIDTDRGIHFSVFNASGGKVIQFTRYDGAKDKTHRELYIITDLEKIGEELGMIILREHLSS